MGATTEITNPVIFFDGVCNLCNSSVQFVIKRDPKANFRFASLQSDLAKQLLPKGLSEDDNLQSIVMLSGDTIYTRSTAALRVAKKLGGLWPVLYSFMLIPKFLRDAVYDFIARNRYKWFGKKDECMIPTPEMKERFLD